MSYAIELFADHETICCIKWILRGQIIILSVQNVKYRLKKKIP